VPCHPCGRRSGSAGAGQPPSPGRELIDLALGMTVDQPGQDIFEIGLGIDGVEFAALDQGGEDGPVVGAVVGAGEQAVLSVQGSRRVILPISGKRWRFTTGGTLWAARSPLLW
jgi:hypothetical protein